MILVTLCKIKINKSSFGRSFSLPVLVAIIAANKFNPLTHWKCMNGALVQILEGSLLNCKDTPSYRFEQGFDSFIVIYCVTYILGLYPFWHCVRDMKEPMRKIIHNNYCQCADL